jgi:glycerate kinase
LGDGETAVIEVAAASGLALLREDELDAGRATSFGTGELVRAALDAGFQRLLIGLGDSATNDGGTGLASALGIQALGQTGAALPPGGAALVDLAYFDVSERHPLLASAAIVALCDVDSPLCGPLGASIVYGPQKGASPANVRRLDDALERFASVVERQFGCAVRDLRRRAAGGSERPGRPVARAAARFSW